MAGKVSESPAPRIAAIVPCYNDGETLTETLDSLEEQEPLELVVVNDGSTDEKTLAVLERLAARGLRVVHKPNGGLSSARMAGVEATSAAYVFALDADDMVAPRSLSPLADELDSHPELGLVWGDLQIFGDWSQKSRMAECLDPWLITYTNQLPVAVLIRREALLEAGGWQLATGWEDWDLWQTLAELGVPGRRVAGVCLLYRRHGTRMSDDSERRRAELTAVLRRRHPDLYASRRANWRRSPSPLLLRFTLPAIEVLPLGGWIKTRLGWLAGDLAHRRPLPAILKRSLFSRLRTHSRRLYLRAGRDKASRGDHGRPG
jgi:glycosyltransferase involved in cell wall biosynthesis